MHEDFCYVVRDRATGQFLRGNYAYSPHWTDDPTKAKKYRNKAPARGRITRMRTISRNGSSYAERFAPFISHLEVVKILRTYFEHSVVPE